MSSLTQVAIGARRAIRYGIFFIIFVLVGKVLLDASIGIYKRLFPAPPPPPTVEFGKLTKIPFPKTDSSLKLTYILETPDGGFPKVSTQAKVYYMPKPNPNLLSLDVGREKANSLGFSSEPQQISDTIYRFKNTDFPSYLEMNIISGSFSISYDLNSDRTPLDAVPPVPEIAASNFRGLLSNSNLLADDLTGSTSHDFLKLSGAKFVTAIALSEANVVKINLFRKTYDELPSMTGNPNEANVWAILSGTQNRNQQIIAAEYHYLPVDESKFSTYPIKTPEEAFNELQSGQGCVANLGVNKDGASLKIRRVYLGYFDPEVETNFFQPIYVFEGDNGFTGYVPAVTADYYGE